MPSASASSVGSVPPSTLGVLEGFRGFEGVWVFKGVWVFGCFRGLEVLRGLRGFKRFGFFRVF